MNEWNPRALSRSFGRRYKGRWRCSWEKSEPQWCLSLWQKGGVAMKGWSVARWQAGLKKKKHHAYGCYSRTRWDRGGDIVKVANTCAPALRAPLVCDQSASSAFLMNMCVRLWQRRGVQHSMTMALKNTARGDSWTVNCGGAADDVNMNILASVLGQ